MTAENLRELLSPYIRQVKQLYGDKLHSIVLYGSYARGEEKPDSDIDIMILVDMTEEELVKYRTELNGLTYDFNWDHDTVVNPIAKSSDFFNRWVNAYPFYANVKKDGVTLYAA